MYILQIEHGVPNYELWKKAFDTDPIGRKQGGVRRYQVSRLIDNSNQVIIDLEFESLNEAQAFDGKLRELWDRPEGRVAQSPRARILQTVEEKRD